MKSLYKNKKVFIFCLLFICNCFSYLSDCQKLWQWAKQLGSTQCDVTTGVACDSKNNLYIAGGFFSVLKCDKKSINSSGNQDIYVAKFDEIGKLNVLWKAGGKGQDKACCITASSDDQIFIGGNISDTVSFDKVINNGVGSRIFISCLTSQCKTNWVTTLQSEIEASLLSISCDKKNNIYVCGNFSGTLSSGKNKIVSHGKNDIFIARLNSTGSIEKLIGIGSDETETASSFSVNDEGGVILTGEFEKSFKCDSIDISTKIRNGKSNSFILQLDADFNTKWVNVIESEEYLKISSVKYDQSGNIYATGSFSYKCWLSDTVFSSQGLTDCFLLKYSESGKIIWSRSFGSNYYDYSNHINVDNLQGVILTGSLGNILTLDDLILDPLSQVNTTMIIQFSPFGDVTWGDCLQSDGRSFSEGSILDRDGNIYISGSFNNNFKKDNEVLTSYGDQDVFLAKYNNCITNRGKIFGAPIICQGSLSELTVSDSYKNVIWGDSITGKSLEISKAGIYRVSMLDKKGCLLADTLRVALLPKPKFSLGNDTSLNCENELLLKAPDKYNQFCWQDKSNNPTFLVSSDTNADRITDYWLSVSDTFGCIGIDTISVRFIKNKNLVNLLNASVFVYPNPINTYLHWQLETSEVCNFNVNILDENGKMIYSEYIENYYPNSSKFLDFSNYSMGTYFVKFQNVTAANNFKIVSVIKQ